MNNKNYMMMTMTQKKKKDMRVSRQKKNNNNRRQRQGEVTQIGRAAPAILRTEFILTWNTRFIEQFCFKSNA